MEIPVKESNRKVHTIKAIRNHIDEVIPEHRVSNPNKILTIKVSAKNKLAPVNPTQNVLKLQCLSLGT